MIVKSFGCSFIYGSDLSDCMLPPEFSYSNFTWPALIAKEKNCQHKCFAQPGVGNLYILQQIMEQVPTASNNDLFIINWTWIDRFDYVDTNIEQWTTLRPTTDKPHELLYFKHIHSQYFDMLTNLSYIWSAISCLLDHQIKFTMTYMDYLLFSQVNPNWHPAAPVTYLQQKIKPYVTDFAGKNFLDWSKDCGYQISKSWHPLEDAHSAAAKYQLTQHLV